MTSAADCWRDAAPAAKLGGAEGAHPTSGNENPDAPKNSAASTRHWVVRVAQEYEIRAKTADEVLAFMHKAENRKIKGARLVDGRACAAPAEPVEK